MIKNELENGMYVRLRDGSLEVVIGDKYVSADGDFNHASYYDNNDLTNNVNHEWDIMKVYVSSSPILFKEDALECIWERNEKHIFTIGDIFYDPSDSERILIYGKDEKEKYYPWLGLTTYNDNDCDFGMQVYSSDELNDYKFVGHDDNMPIGISATMSALKKFEI